MKVEVSLIDEVKDYVDGVKEHIKRHKVAYSCGVTAVVTAGITCLIMKGRHAELLSGSDTAENSVFVRPFNLFSNRCNVNVVNVLEREGRGHPGYIVRCLETGTEFFSQKKAASNENVSDAIMSLHLRGKIDDINGYHFERLQVA